MTTFPYTVHEAEVAVFHAWGDGMPVGGPVSRHLLAPVVDDFRSSLKISQVAASGDAGGGFGEWRQHGPQAAAAVGWQVELGSAFGAMVSDGTAVATLPTPGMPVVLVVRFLCEESGQWRLFQFHDCVALPADAGNDGQVMTRTVRFSAGHLEEFKSGVMPVLEPRLRGVIEWQHLGRTVRCWEYDPVSNVWVEDAENASVVEEETVRYVSLDIEAGAVDFSYLAARTVPTTSGGLSAIGIGWIDAITLTVPASGGLEFAPGWVLEANGCAEPLRLPPSGRHWEHPRVVFRFLGRIYATVEAGVFALPTMANGTPDEPIDFPIRLGRLALYPDGGYLLPS